MIKTKKLTVLALLSAAALIFAYVESLFPPLVASVPGIKMGLPNIAIIFTLYKFGVKEAFAVSFIRLIFVSLLFGNLVSLSYSFAGALLSLSVMAILKKYDLFSLVGISVSGGVLHNLGQILVAVLLTGVGEIAYYMIFLAVSGTVSGILIGLASAFIIKRIKLKI
ncbi:MAG: Gx transporter family protein [Ruminococcaceae bacterium]|nr:Gx transporter family protein [Oscillospiraceae bacterium]